jgi:hypothetical protein
MLTPADDLLARYNRACELRHAPDREKIRLAIRRWALAIGIPDLAVIFVANAEGVRHASRIAREARDASAKPVVNALTDKIGRSAWKWASRHWGTAVAGAAGRAGEVTLAAATGIGGDGFARAADQRDTSAARMAWGPTGPTWWLHGAWDLHALADNAIWASAGGRPLGETVLGRSGEAQETLLEKWLGVFEAFEAGAWIMWIGAGMLYVAEIPRQVLLDDQGRLHSADGPAFVWLDDIHGFYWHGIYVPDYVIMQPAEISVAKIAAQTNADVRRVMIERSNTEAPSHGATDSIRDAGG